MEPITTAKLEDGALVVVDSAPIIYSLEGRAPLARRFRPLFDRHAKGQISFAVTTITIAEVLTGPLMAGDDVLAERYRAVLTSWNVIELTTEIAATAARLRAALKLMLPDAVQAASALAVNADALVTHDRDFSRLTVLRVLG
ncbi:MAG: type II toxin-antitoxin system VapC family toxin [Deltaproteobacteria bacterium]|nr:type II toxin-antitoxin system VapC family toxin [Deltaproteobacteria bacterium]